MTKMLVLYQMVKVHQQSCKLVFIMLVGKE